MKITYTFVKQTTLFNPDGSIDEDRSKISPVASTDDERVLSAVLLTILSFQNRQDCANNFAHVLSTYVPSCSDTVRSKFDDAINTFMTELSQPPEQEITGLLAEILEEK